LTTVAGSPFAAGTQLNAIGGDNSGSYILAAAFGGGPDLAMYSFDTTTPGKLDLVTSAQTGTDPTGASTIALTH
jgi:6-phosphogluconolactonase